MKRMFSKEELEAIIKNVTDIDEVKEDISNLEDVALNAKTKGFVDSEYNKQLNLWDEQWEVGEINSSTGENANTGVAIRSKGYISVTPNTDYSDTIGTSTLIIYQYDSSKNYISAIFGKSNNTFKVSENCYYIRFATDTPYGTSYLNDIIFVKGTTPVPYQAYNGAVLHEKDITPVLLWENATPNVAFEAGNITVGDTSPFKYLIIGFKHYAGAGYGVNYFKCLKELNKSIIISSPFGSNIRTRSMEITANTTIDVKTGYNNGTAETSSGIPVVIYGTNVL